jgi:hypothetical protein
MSIGHLNDEEFDRLLAGEQLAGDRLEHLRDCLSCRRRRDGAMAVIEDAAADDPGDDARGRAREAALAAWGRPVRRFHRWWLAAAAALLVALLLPLTHRSRQQQAGFDPETVMQEVDAILARDPLTVLASEEVVEAVTTAPGQATEGSTS